MSDQAAKGMTVAEFLVWQTGQEDKYELVNGRPFAMTGARLRHDRVTGNAFSEVRRQLRANGSPCDAFTSDIGILTVPGQLRRPDVSVLCPPFDEESMTSDSPRLVVEVLSESTEQIDRLVKLDEYKTLETLDYIVFADPTRVEVGVWFRDSGGVWRNQTFQQADSVIHMPGLGLSISVAALYERVTLTPRPRPRLVWDDADEAAPPINTRTP
ncbi:MAG: Uma2 family endonuclease [Acetobacteraceae bacterium]|nr:Uma2 family endonuclease [Acetobacteraceae bacterium]